MVKQGLRLFAENKAFRKMILEDIAAFFLFVGMHVFINWTIGRSLTTRLSMGVFSVSHVVLSLVVLSAILLNAYHIKFPGYKLFINFGMLWAVLLGYLTVIALVVNLLWALAHALPSWSALEAFFDTPRYMGILWMIIVASLALILLAGCLAARFPKVKAYNIQVNKTLDREMRIALIADLHYGDATTTANLDRIARKVNAMEPDILVIAGDILDLPLDRVGESDFHEKMRLFHPKRGIYAVLGNHEYMNATLAGKSMEAKEHELIVAANRWVEYYKSCGIETLRDDLVDLGDIILVGRDDQYADSWRYIPRKSTTALCRRVQENHRPIVLIDHQPEDISREDMLCVDLLLSGHTHAGQIFPLNILLPLFSKFVYGHKIVEGRHAVVTSGAGTWGPPLRIGARAEVVQINLSGIKK